MRRIPLLLLALTAALGGTASPAHATTRRCDLVVTFCATASASFDEASSCATPPPGTSGLCASHSGSGYVFYLRCVGEADGPAYVQLFGCGQQVAGGLLGATIGEEHWAWNATLSMCYDVTANAIFDDTIVVQVSDHTCW